MKNKLLASSKTLEGIIKLISDYYMGSTITIVDEKVYNKKGIISDVCVVNKKGSFRFERINQSVYLNVDDIRTLLTGLNIRKEESRVSPLNHYKFKVVSVDSGCKKGVPIKDWEKVLHEWDKIKGNRPLNR